MAKSQVWGSSNNTINFGQTRYISFGGLNDVQTTETDTVQVTFRSAGVVSDFQVRLYANTLNSGACTFTSRKNAADGSITTSSAFGTTGLFEDTSNTDTIAAADEYNFKAVTTGTSGLIRFNAVSAVFAATTNTVCIYTGGTNFNYNVNGTRYFVLCGNVSQQATETDAEQYFEIAGTLKNLFLNSASNSRDATCTVTTRKSGVDQSMVLSIGAAATGFFEDTSNTVTIAAGDRANLKFTGGTTGTLSTGNIKTEFATTTNKTQLVSNGNGPGDGVTNYYAVGGFAGGRTTESDSETKAKFAFTASELACYLAANATTGTSTFDLRLTNASSALTVSITAAATGYFEDATHTVSVASGTSIDLRFVNGGGGAITLRHVGMVLEPVTTTIKTVNGLARASVKTDNGLAVASTKTRNGLA